MTTRSNVIWTINEVIGLNHVVGLSVECFLSRPMPTNFPQLVMVSSEITNHYNQIATLNVTYKSNIAELSWRIVTSLFFLADSASFLLTRNNGIGCIFFTCFNAPQSSNMLTGSHSVRLCYAHVLTLWERFGACWYSRGHSLVPTFRGYFSFFLSRTDDRLRQHCTLRWSDPDRLARGDERSSHIRNETLVAKKCNLWPEPSQTRPPEDCSPWQIQPTKIYKLTS